ncbi:YraN family protein [Puteibacter caeruleilacunae]|nr:YraN family protein [Puteibacter caeruleilacunae]
MARHNDLGKEGEDIARTYLMKKGFRILEVNWRYGKEEIDIIALDKNELVIVEVKTRSSAYYQHPWEAITNRKQRYLINAADAYIQMTESDLETRFDVVSIIYSNGSYQIEHIPDAFYPGIC